MAEEAEAEASGEAEESKGGGKKKIVMIVVALLLGAFVAKTMFLKPPPPTQAELDLAKKVETLEVWAMCAAANEQPFDVAAAEAEIEAEIEKEHALAKSAESGTEHADEAESPGAGTEAPADADPAAPAGDTNAGPAPGAGGLGLRAVAVRVASAGGGTSSVDPVYENDPVTLNLADGVHYVKVRVALQLGSGVDVEALSINNFGSRAQDAVNTRLRGLTMDQLQAPEAVTALKRELGNEICRAYHGEVTTIYFAEFVTQ